MTVNEYEEILNDLLRVFNKKNPDIPERIINKSLDNLVRVYAKAYNNLYQDALTNISEKMGINSNPDTHDVLILMGLLENRVKELNNEISNEVRTEIEKNYLIGNVLHAVITENITDFESLKNAVPYTTLNKYTAEQLIYDTLDDLLYATSNTSFYLKKLVRNVFQKHLTLAGLEKTGQKELIKRIQSELTKKGLSDKIKKDGFIGIIDKLGRKWELNVYVKMVIKTKLSQAYHEGLKDKAHSTGKDLAMISKRGATDSCKYFEGIIISMTGASKGFMTYDQCKATGLVFHPNCRHNCYPVRGLEYLHEDDIKVHESQLKLMKNIVANSKKKNKK